MERSPRLNTDQLPKNTMIPNDILLRGASAAEVAGATRAWLVTQLPPARSVMVTLARDSEQLARIERRWKRMCRLQGIPETHALLDPFDRAVTMFGEIVLLSDVVAELESFDLPTRARATRTIMHEWWHVARLESGRFYPFEEGAADVFADTMYQKAFGATSPNLRTYTELAEAVTLIGIALNNPDWYIESRVQVSVMAWLSQILNQNGFNTLAINQVLSYTGNTDDSTWLVRVRRMLSP